MSWAWTPRCPPANPSPAPLQASARPRAPGMGVPAPQGKMAARLANCRREEWRGQGQELEVLLALLERRPSLSVASSFPKASALLPNQKAGQGGSCRPCRTPRPERPPRQGKAPARPGTLGLEQAEVRPWALWEPPIQQSGN